MFVFISTVVAILCHQLDYIRIELKSRSGQQTCDPNLEAGRQYAFDQDLEAGRHTFNLGYTFCYI